VKGETARAGEESKEQPGPLATETMPFGIATVVLGAYCAAELTDSLLSPMSTKQDFATRSIFNAKRL
jgi:hypothetical protein